ncbi:DNA repair protein XRCC4 isoform X1 [Typha angustifolia]|uniref:DNA repair protein XRCC4 isoform X1 n=1 Tax=Typha angustifolia TaxID=59011 RepID=UPI003C2D027D
MAARHSCLKLELPVEDPKEFSVVFVKGTWLPSRFSLAITDGLDAWICQASDAEVKMRADQWDQPVEEYIALAERYLGFQQPDSKYAFEDAGNGQRRLSWTFEKQGTKLEWRWKCQPSPDRKITTAEILDFLMDANICLSEEVVRKTQSFNKLKVEAERCLQQTERFNSEKAEFESAVYSKFVAVLNSKKAKLKELRDRVSKLESADKALKEEDVSSGKTESFDEAAEEENIKEEPIDEEVNDLQSASEKVTTAQARGRKKTRR